MKNILVATDLSAAATHATDYAAWLATALEAKLTLLSVYRPAPVFAGSSISETEEDRLPEIVTCRLEEEATRLGANNRRQIDIITRTGDSVRAILATARDIHADLVIVGKTGAGQRGNHCGRTAVALARKTTIPLLIVPREAIGIPPAAIAVARDVLTNRTPEVWHRLLNCFGSGVYLFHITAKGPDEIVQISRVDAIHGTGDTWHPIYQIPVDLRLRHSMENFIEANPIHWLVVKPLQGIPPERWMLNGRTTESAFGIHVPLLIIPAAR